MEILLIHKPFGIILEDDGRDKLTKAHETMDNIIENDGGALDWYQGLIHSNRWPDYEHLDGAQDMDDPKVLQSIIKLLHSSEKEIREWIQKGFEYVEKDNLDTAITHFSICSGSYPCHVYDNTGYSNDFVRTEKEFKKLRKWHKEEKKKYYIYFLDVHY